MPKKLISGNFRIILQLGSELFNRMGMPYFKSNIFSVDFLLKSLHKLLSPIVVLSRLAASHSPIHPTKAMLSSTNEIYYALSLIFLWLLLHSKSFSFTLLYTDIRKYTVLVSVVNC